MMVNEPSLDKEEVLYLELQADLGITKHLGGLSATEELVKLCRIGKDKNVLDVGCGAGKTPCYLAETYGCEVVAVDISRRMIDRSRERAKRSGVEGRVEFKVADVQDLPFEDDLFDVVVGESIAAFVEDKRKAVAEYGRVAIPGGYIGLNETTWIMTPPPVELIEYLVRTTGARPKTSKAWQELLEALGLRDVEVRTHKVSLLSEWVDEARWLDLRDFLGPWSRLLVRYLRSPAYRRFVKGTWPMPKGYFEYLGYGTYVGKK